jgi:hypothetical protein
LPFGFAQGQDDNFKLLAMAEGMAEASGVFGGAILGSGGFGDVGAFGVEDDKATGAFAAGGGGQAGVFEDEVKHAPLTGVHGGEWVGSSGGPDTFDGGGGGLAHVAIAVGLEVVGVEGDQFLLVEFEAQDLDCEMFEGVQHLSVVRGQQMGVGPTELDAEGPL